MDRASTAGGGPRVDLSQTGALLVRQRHEIAELFGFETRNKYEVLDERGQLVAFAAEQGKGFLPTLLRWFLGHWRRFEIHVFSPDHEPLLVARHPFRWLLQRLEVYDPAGNHRRDVGRILDEALSLASTHPRPAERAEAPRRQASPPRRIAQLPVTLEELRRLAAARRDGGPRR